MEVANKCNLCGKAFTARSSLQAHILSVHEGIRRPPRKKKFKCNVCGQEVWLEGHLINHMRIHTGERPFKCTVPDCEMAFKVKGTLKEHMQRKHSDERPFKCQFAGCLHSAKTSADLTVHARVHNNDRPFYCPNSECDFRAKHSRYLRRHVRIAHSGLEPFACSKCEYKTMRAFHLKRHMHRHSSIRIFKCKHPQCEESFKTSNALKLHFSNRHGARSLTCDHLGCGRKFGSVKALRDHERVFHAKKSYVCSNPNCGYRTHKQEKLADHVLYHTGRNTKVSCLIEGCDYKGKNRSALKTHMSLHKILLACPTSGCGRHFSTNQGLQDHIKLHNSSGRPFQCPLCFKFYPTLPTLRKHCAIHTNEKPFVCGHCEYAASLGSHVKDHISSAHPNIKFPAIVLPVNDRECVRCEMTLSAAEFLVHSMGHAVPVVMIQRLETTLL